MEEQRDPVRESAEADAQPGLHPQLYIASLSDYNAGRLHGVWLDATMPVPELEDGIAAMLAASPEPAAEEWAIHDSNDFAGLTISEHEDLDYINLLAEGLVTHGPAYAAWADICGDPGLLESFEQAYLGHYDDLAAYAHQMVEDLGYAEQLAAVVPAAMAPYVQINEEALGRDLWLGGDIAYAMAEDGGIWIFDNRL